MTRLEAMAAFAADVRYDKLPEDVRYRLKICVLDALECCLSDMEDTRSRAAYQSVPKGEQFPCTIIGTAARSSAEDAAFYNTAKGALTNRNDSSRTAICHPGCILVPVTIALGEEDGVSGMRMLEAMLAGYETMIRLGTTFVMAGIRESFRKTSLVAAFGAAFSAALMKGLDEAGIASAASFACHAAGGVNEWAVQGTGEDIFQNGWGARNGIYAMRLAKAGADGARTILEGKSGLLDAFDALREEARLTDGLGERYDILDIMYKPIDCCFIVQPPCQTAKGLLDTYGIGRLTPEEVEMIEIFVSRQGKDYPGCANTEKIDTLVQAIMSIGFGVSSTLYLGSHDHISWMPPAHPDIMALLHKCRIAEDQQMTAAFPHLQGARVKVTLKDGRILENEQKDVRPLTTKEVRARFLKTAGKRLGEERAKEVEARVMRLDQEENIRKLCALLTA